MSTSTVPSLDNTFNHSVNSFFDQLAKHWRILAGLGVLLLIAAAVIAVAASHQSQKSDAGRNALYLAERSLDTQMLNMAKAEMPAAPVAPKDTKDAKAAPKAPQPNVDALLFRKMDVDTQFSDGVSKLKAVAADFTGTRPGFEATLLLGQLYLNHGDSAKAAEWFTKATEGAATPLDRALSWESLGYSQENQGKYKEALDAFEKALNIGEATIKGDLMMAKARSFESLKDTKQAQATYDQIEKDLPNTEYAKLAELYKARLQ